jgi:uncharacterized protein (DUF934 family)
MSVVDSCLEVPVLLVTSVHWQTDAENRQRPARFRFSAEYLRPRDQVLQLSQEMRARLAYLAIAVRFPLFYDRRFKSGTVSVVLRPIQTQNLKLRIFV